MRYGAGIVYSEEVIDKAILRSTKSISENKVEFRSNGDGSVVFSTIPEELDKLVFQMGTADAQLAAEAGRLVIDHVSGIDVNMGCPKHFSVHCGMGAGLLKTPDRAVEIITALRQVVPSTKSLSCKIRLIGDLCDMDDVVEQTSEYICRMYSAGADAVTLHLRTVPQRPRERATWEMFGRVHLRVKKRLLDGERGALASNFVLIPNGDFFVSDDILKFSQYMNGVDANWCNSFMIARGALRCPAIFLDKPLIDQRLKSDGTTMHGSPRRNGLAHQYGLAHQNGRAHQNGPAPQNGPTQQNGLSKEGALTEKEALHHALADSLVPEMSSVLSQLIDAYKFHGETYQACKWIVSRVLSENEGASPALKAGTATCIGAATCNDEDGIKDESGTVKRTRLNDRWGISTSARKRALEVVCAAKSYADIKECLNLL